MVCVRGVLRLCSLLLLLVVDDGVGVGRLKERPICGHNKATTTTRACEEEKKGVREGRHIFQAWK